METAQFAARLTCFALLSAIEQDLRDLVESVLRKSGKMDVLPEDIRQIASSRWAQSRDALDQAGSCNDFQLLKFTDFADLAQLLHLHVNDFWQLDAKTVKRIASDIESLSPARNRVCHSRPLEPDDFSNFFDFTQALVKSKNSLGWISSIATLEKLRSDPSFVLKLSIPEHWKYDQRGIPHNLPLPEFDDTGYLGRSNDRAELSKLLLSPHPVITVVGQGGMGKTALALRVLYDLLSQPNKNPFDAIIWCSLKTKILTHTGIREIENSITSTIGVVHAIGKQLGTSVAPGNIEQSITELSEYLSAFRILLAIDNLETISAQSLRPLFSNIGTGSKVLVTSRVGLGELELRYPLPPMDQQTAETLFRRYAKVNQQNQLASTKRELLSRYCELLHNNPLLIRWFVSSVSAGADPARILNRHGKPFTEVLKFCFENLFERLTDNERTVLWTLASVPRPVSQTELSFLCDSIPADEFDWAQNTLLRSSMLKTVQEQAAELSIIPRTLFSLTEISAEYVSQLAPPPHVLFTGVQRKLKELRQLAESEAAKANAFKYDTTAIRASNSDHRVAAAYLRRAMTFAKSKNIAEARIEIEEARRYAPAYSEVYRVSGWIEGAYDSYKAQNEFLHALELQPDSAVARFSFAHFLIRYLEDYDRAIEQIDWLLKEDPEEPAVNSLKAVALTRSGRFQLAEAIYDRLIATLSERPRKWRITTIDQAAECFRRWAELEARNDDDRASFSHLKKAIKLLWDAFDKDDYDEKMIDLAEEVLEFASRKLHDISDPDMERQFLTDFQKRHSSKLQRER
jgi:LuxR family glucitol operon transcriptional activator